MPALRVGDYQPRNWAFGEGKLRHIRELVLISCAYFAYMFARKFVISDVETIAVSNALKIISFEASLGIFWEPHWQSWAHESARHLLVFFNWVYIITFWPIIGTTGVILYFKSLPRYRHYRNIVMLSFVVALIVFTIFPLAPPRMMPQFGFIDTIKTFGPTFYDSRSMAAFYNAFAAMPSLHFAWTILIGVLFIRSRPLWLKVIGVLYPTATFFAITLTANHYILDAVGGTFVIVASFLLYEAVFRHRGGTSRPRQPSPSA